MSNDNLTQDPAIGMEIGSYRVTGVLGKGGMGVVYKAEHPGIGKKVAVKLLNARFSTQQDTVNRFFREAKAVNDIHHENVIDVLDFGKLPSGECYIIMEFLDGIPLTAALKGGATLPIARLGHIALQVCSALEAAHQKGIVHRDLKPDNIFLITRSAKPDFVKLLDFGIAKLLYNDDVPVETNAGAMIGTPMYMSPEQALGGKIDHQSDIYSLGVMLYQMATGAPPFYDNNPITMAMHHITMEAKPPKEKNPALSQAFSDLIMRCLAKETTDRYQTMLEVAFELGRACALAPGPYLALLSSPPPPQAYAPSAFSTQETQAPGQTSPQPTNEAKTSEAFSVQPTMGPGGVTNQASGARQETLGASSGEVVAPASPPKRASAPLLIAASVGVTAALAFALVGLGVINLSPAPQNITASAPLSAPVSSRPSAPEAASAPRTVPAATTLPTLEGQPTEPPREPVVAKKKPSKPEPKNNTTKPPVPDLDGEEGIKIESLEKKN